MQPPQIFDHNARQMRRARALASTSPALFLHEHAAAQILERLSEVNKSFTDVVIITGFAEPWRQVFPNARIIDDAEVLDLTPNSCDLLLHGLSLHGMNDPVGQMIQCARALRSDGLFIGVMFGGQTLQELRVAMAEAETELSGGLSPRIAPMGELRDLGNLLSRAGLALPVADSDRLTVSYNDLASLIGDLRAMAETNILQHRKKNGTPRQLFHRAEEIYRAHYADPSGRLNATFELITLTGWGPSDTQQKPLRPGSAQARLAEALGTVELSEDATPVGLDPKLP